MANSVNPFSATLNSLWKGSNHLLPSDFLDHIQGDPAFGKLYQRGGRQEDMSEAFQVITDNYLGQSTPFDFMVGNSACCGSCGKTQLLSEGRTELVRELQLGIAPGAKTLQYLLRLHFRAEIMDPDTPWIGCTGCPPSKKSTKSLRLENLPRVLTIQLKRFRYSSDGVREYVKDYIAYPKQLRMDTFCKSGAAAVYNLVAVGRHSGVSLDAGHFFAWAKHQFDGHWYIFSDTRVSRLETDPDTDDEGSRAYMFFYVLGS